MRISKLMNSQNISFSCMNIEKKLYFQILADHKLLINNSVTFELKHVYKTIYWYVYIAGFSYILNCRV